MRDSATSGEVTTAELIANRYQVEDTLGQGGMATVYLVRDITTQRRLALKRPLIEDERANQDEILALFEHEFYTLAQLAHPRVVEAYDFGRDDSGPYYTMELLDGGDLRELSPLHWKRACSVLADVCSVLSLLHSRRLVYRDLSHRNVRCTRDLKAKLIDFGAMVPMGPCKHAVGTPAFAAPEVVAMQALDARADLYSLGAVLYYALTGRPAYPARNFRDLRDAWRSKPRPPSAFVEDIPKELDHLVLSLIDLDPIARPVNAAEVTERLSAIGGFTVDEHLLVSKAYLTTPTLVGRGAYLSRARKRMLKLRHRSGTAILIEGAAGVGRTRFLDACVLEAKLSGAAVLRADASDAHAGDWGTARVLATGLIDELPQQALEAARPHLPVLGHILPELLGRLARRDASSAAGPSAASGATDAIATDAIMENRQEAPPSAPDRPSVRPGILVGSARPFRSWRPPPQATRTDALLETFDDPQELRPRLQAALLEWFLAIGEAQPLMVAVDDIHRIDEPSAAFVARLCNEVFQKKMFVAATAQTDGPVVAAGAMQLLRKSAVRFGLTNLAQDNTEQLLGSVFGETPNVRLLADRLQGISQGNPRAIMELAQHLVDKGLVHYQAGTWTLPNRIDAGDLPGSLTETLKAKADKLSPDALQLAQILALSPEQAFSVDECRILYEKQDRAPLLQSLNELVTAGILSTDGQHYSLSQQGWVSPLTDGLDDDRRRAFHLKMAEMFSQRELHDFRVALHLFAAGEEERGLDVLVHDAETSQKQLAQNTEAFYKYIHSLPPNWLEVYQLALRLCQTLNRPRKQAFMLRMSVIRFSMLTGLEDIALLHDVTDQLFQDSGLGFYRDLGDSMDAESRLWRALELAQQHYDATPPSERVLSPEEAISELASAISYVMGTASNANDYSVVAAMPSLAPLEPLTPALGVADKVLNAGRYLLSARHDRAREEIREILDRIAQPDRAGLDEAIHRITHFSWAFAMGVLEASFGLESSLKWADEVEQDALHQVNAWRIRMVYYLRQGDSDKAEECGRRVELLLIQNSPTQHFEDTNLVTELLVHGFADDLARVKTVIEGIERGAARFRTWIPMLHFAKAEYQRIRGDHRNALNEIEQALALIAPGRHVIWPHAVATQLRILFELERFSEARQIGYESLAEAERQDIRTPSNDIRMPLALIEAKLGEYESAVRHAETAIGNYKALGATGLNLGMAYEVRARVASLMEDQKAFGEYAQLCSEQYRAGHNPVLTAKFEKLVHQAGRSKLVVADAVEPGAFITRYSMESLTSLRDSLLTATSGSEARLQRALEALVKEGPCLGGFLYTMDKDGPALRCRSGDCTPPPNMQAIVAQYVQSETDESGDVTMTVADLGEAASSQLEWTNHRGEQYVPVLLGHDADDGFCITGAAVLLPKPDRPFVLPAKSAAIVSSALLEAGDADGVFLASE